MIENNYAYHLSNNAYYVAFNGQDAPMFVSGGKTLLERYGVLLDEQILPRIDETNLEKTQSGLEVYLSTTNLCNLGCADCAASVDVRKTLPVIEPDLNTEKMIIGIGQIFKTTRNHNKTEIKFKYAGGEPTLPQAFQKVILAHDEIQKLRNEYLEIIVDEVILTNGTFLNDALLEKVKQMGMRLSISLWGIGGVNNITRKVKRPIDSYEHIIEGIKRVVEAGIHFNIHHVISPENADSFPEFITRMWDTDSPFFIGRDWNWPNGEMKPIPLGINIMRPQSLKTLTEFNESGYSKIVKGFKNGLVCINDMILKGIDVPISALTGLDYLNIFRQRPTTCGAGESYIVMGSNGFTYCHEAMLKNRPNWEEAFNSEDLLEFVNRLSDFNIPQIQTVGLNFGDRDSINNILSVIGGAGCPRTRREEGKGIITSEPASISKKFYRLILPDLLKVIYNYFAIRKSRLNSTN